MAYKPFTPPPRIGVMLTVDEIDTLREGIAFCTEEYAGVLKCENRLKSIDKRLSESRNSLQSMIDAPTRGKV